MKDGIPPTRRSAGRPTREQAEARLEELLDTALDLFLEHGFELATIEMIATQMNMTKRTVYAKFPDKAALFLAAVQRAIERQIVPPEDLRKLDQGDLRETLRAIGHQRIGLVLTRNGLRLQRIINTESFRFPNLLMLNYNQSGRPVTEFIVELLEREISRGTMRSADPMLAASVFLSMVVSGPVRQIVAGIPPEAEEIERIVDFAVDVFLDGMRVR
ncbi:TetR/AcrR family transcriptional regulator [Novosphingobium sp. TH158]|uniref:TetR/AcrR family transcriptional regulator n=1 Tax=Novosphingobium sp. TH158 TaxID=2067455 RepID=UPI000C7DF0A6|nr:TetR/AcrR family transcriptional regulator [Novosphingobium sp. TH158]PLK26157.1 TetR family transcriptional regulator [Novosphingobium sp. TH158]